MGQTRLTMSAKTISSSTHLSRMLALSLLMCIKLRQATQQLGPGAQLVHYDVLALGRVKNCAGCTLLTIPLLNSDHPRYPEHAGTPNTPAHMQDMIAFDTELKSDVQGRCRLIGNACVQGTRADRC